MPSCAGLGFKSSPDPARYEFLKLVGNGNYGYVACVREVRSGISLAMKRIHDLQEYTICRRTLRELKLMRHFRHKNLLQMKDVLFFGNTSREIFFVTALMDCDLSDFLHKRRGTLTDSHVRGFMYQMLLGVLHLHSGHVVHRDIKPANIFLRKDGLLKIGDFGLARGIGLDMNQGLEPTRDVDELLTEYVVTRWWRAPEIFLTPSLYGPPVDVWSLGCVLSEMVTGSVLFQGKNSFDQLKRILAVTGVPSGEFAASLRDSEVEAMLKQMPRYNPDLNRLGDEWKIPVSDGLLDLMTRMLTLVPGERVSSEQALRHMALSDILNPMRIEEAKKVAVFDQSYDKKYDGLPRPERKHVLPGIQRLLFEEVCDFHGRRQDGTITAPVATIQSDSISCPQRGIDPNSQAAARDHTNRANTLEDEGVYEHTPHDLVPRVEASADACQCLPRHSGLFSRMEEEMKAAEAEMHAQLGHEPKIVLHDNSLERTRPALESNASSSVMVSQSLQTYDCGATGISKLPYADVAGCDVKQHELPGVSLSNARQASGPCSATLLDHPLRESTPVAKRRWGTRMLTCHSHKLIGE